MKSKITLLIMLAVIVLSSVACGDIRPIQGDSRNINQITNEVTHNTQEVINGGVFNQVWESAN